MSEIKQYDFDSEFQDLVLACWLKHPDKFLIYGPIMNPRSFSGVLATLLAQAINKHYQSTGQFPTWRSSKQLFLDEVKKLETSQDDSVAFFEKIRAIDTRDVDVVVSRIRNFVRERAILSAVRKTVENIQEDKKVDIIKLFEEAMSIGQNLDDLGYVLHDDIDRVVDKVTARDYGIKTGITILDTVVWKHGLMPGWLIVPLAPPKRYKCLKKGTKVMLSNGSVKRVEHIVVDDLLMGDDGTSRRVETCGNGFGPLYKVHQEYGSSYTCNDEHILCLVSESGEYTEITAQEFYERSRRTPSWSRNWQGYKRGVEFEPSAVELDPYWLGLWLGDGNSRHAAITVSHEDREVAEFVTEHARSLGMKLTLKAGTGCTEYQLKESKPLAVSGKRFNRVKAALMKYKLLMNKHIPACYQHNSAEIRLKLLAGLLDSDGGFVHNLGFVFTNVNRSLANGVLWLAKSLGFRAKLKTVKTRCQNGFQGRACRVTISGQLSTIPTLLPRKRGTDSLKHRFNNYKIKVTKAGRGEWFGFTIGGNRKFLLHDFTVTHNTMFCLNVAMNVVGPAIGKNVFYYSCEISQELAMARALSNLTGLSQDFMFENPEEFKRRAHNQKRQHISGYLVFKGFPAGSTTIADIRAHATAVCQQHGIIPHLIIIDYAETVLPSVRKHQDHREQADIYTDARALGAKFNCPVIMPDRCNAETVDKPVPNMRSFQGAFQKAGIVDGAIGLCATDAEYQRNILRGFIFINRHGKAYQHFRGVVDPEAMQLQFDTEIPYEPEDGLIEQRGGRKRPKGNKEGPLPEGLQE